MIEGNCNVITVVFGVGTPVCSVPVVLGPETCVHF